MPDPKTFPNQARVVIIGGGIMGCSTAYHLTRAGMGDVVLLEQGRLTGGTTWHAAGLVGQLRAHQNMTRLVQHSVALYAALEAETGLATGWKQCGSLIVARSPERMTALRRTASVATAQGVPCHVLSPREAGDRYPLMRTGDLQGALWLPSDGKANPADVTQALARGARMGGARIFERTQVTAIRTKHGVVAGVSTPRGDVACEVVVNCAGQWAKRVGRLAGVTVPLHSAEHMYIVTGRIDGVTADLPVLRDPDGYVYCKEEVGGLLVGGFEPVAKPWGMDGIPDDFEFGVLPDDWDQFQILMENALHRLPALESAAVKTFMNGPESFTPDNNFILGEAPELRNFFVGAGFNSIGIASGGGAGRALAEWIVEGEPSLDLWPVDIRRFAQFHGDDAWLKERVSEVLGLHYAMPWPNRELTSARPLRRSPLFGRLAAKHALFGQKMGWERPNFFAPAAADARLDYSFGRQNWFPYAAEEHRAARQAVAVFDLSSFAKFLLTGPGAEAALQHLCANDVAVPVGQTVYTGMLNERGTYESDLTVARLAADSFLIITGTAQATRDAHWIRRHLPTSTGRELCAGAAAAYPPLKQEGWIAEGDPGRGRKPDATHRREASPAGLPLSGGGDGAARAVLTDVTAEYAVIAVAGPRSREVLTRVAGTALDNDAFPFGAIREIKIGDAALWAARRSYVGELGWELYVPAGFAAGVYDRLMEAGKNFGVRDGGYYALESLRLEKGYRAWGRELTPDSNPYEAGLGFAVRFDNDFIGRDALVAAKGKPPAKRLVSLIACTADTPLAHGGEVILRDGRPVGEVTSAAYGHTVGALVALGYAASGGAPLSEASLAQSRFELDIAGEHVPVRASLAAPYDPRGERVRS